MYFLIYDLNIVERESKQSACQSEGEEQTGDAKIRFTR